MRNITELHDDLLVKILSFVPAKEVAATSVLSKRWYCLWKQDVDYVELCDKCSIGWIGLLFPHSPTFPNILWPLRENVLDEHPNFVSLISSLKANACIGCKGRIHGEKKVTMFIIHDAKVIKKYWASVIWTKLEEKQQMLIEVVSRRETILNYHISVT